MEPLATFTTHTKSAISTMKKIPGFMREDDMPSVMQSAMSVAMGPFQTGSLPLVRQQRYFGRTARVQTSTQQPPVNYAAGNPQIDAPLSLISEGPGGLEPVLAAHPVQQPVILD